MREVGLWSQSNSFGLTCQNQMKYSALCMNLALRSRLSNRLKLTLGPFCRAEGAQFTTQSWHTAPLDRVSCKSQCLTNLRFAKSAFIPLYVALVHPCPECGIQVNSKIGHMPENQHSSFSFRGETAAGLQGSGLHNNHIYDWHGPIGCRSEYGWPSPHSPQFTSLLLQEYAAPPPSLFGEGRYMLE